jgi:hypothetical protein
MSEVSGAIECPVIGRLIADPVDERRTCTPRIVQVRYAVGKAGPKMQQRRGGATRHARPSVRGARADVFKQS